MVAFIKSELEHVIRQIQTAHAQFHADTGAPNPPVQAPDQIAQPGAAGH